jgi:ATP-dependent DNA helicase DinG
MSEPQTTTPLSPDSAAPLILESAAAAFRGFVAEYGGSEVFAIGTVDQHGCVASLEFLAFGNQDMVPAPAQNARSGQVLIHNHPGGYLEPSNADIGIASMYGKAGIGFYIVDNDCRDVRVVVKPFKEQPAVPIDLNALMSHFGPDGIMARSMPGYEHRPEQMQMISRVARAFNEDRIAVVEAGTGTGKSYAYLAPALAWGLANRKRIVISTNTINLQEQLLNKDLPELAKRLGWKFKASLVKGRSNYISLRRLKFAANDKDLFDDDRGQELKQLAEWSRISPDGSRSDLPFEVRNETWDAAASDKDDCQRAQCPNFNECFFYKSRREAASADLIIANHHLVMADVALRKNSEGNDYTAILPPFERVIFDEAHNLEETATSYFSAEVSLFAIRRQLNRLYVQQAPNPKGALWRLQRALFNHDSKNLYAPTGAIFAIFDTEVIPRRRMLDDTLEAIFSELFQRTVSYFGGTLSENDRREYRITRDVTHSLFWTEAVRLLQEAADELSLIVKPLEKMMSLCGQYPDNILREIADYRLAAGGAIAKLGDHCETLKFFLQASDEEFCRWLEVGHVRGRPFVRPCTAPLVIAPALRAALHSRKRTLVFTSATLTVNSSFEFFAKTTGLGGQDLPGGEGNFLHAKPQGSPDPDHSLEDVEARTDFLQLGTPFDYSQNCRVAVPIDLPEPNDARFEQAIAPTILETVKITGGRAFVLFTSYKSLQKTLDILRTPLAQAGLAVFRQGEMPRHRLLQSFRSASHAVLFATSSFWEGVDVQGQALECLILTKLPFSVPSTPILEARSERIDRLGGSSFYDYNVPMAVIKFKQGFGRLIRSKTDRGIVLITDRRVFTKPYGKIFVKSLPAVPVDQGPAAEVVRILGEFYNTRRT